MDLKNIDLKNIKIDDLVSKIKTIEKKVLLKLVSVLVQLLFS